MAIRLNNVIPLFLENEKINRSEVWNKPIEILEGDRVQVVAPSGSGKTSFIHFLYKIRTDYEGSILIDDKNIRSLSPEDVSANRRERISVIFQDLRLFHDHTVLQNIEVKRALKPYHQKEIIEEMAAKLGIINKLAKPVRTCSYGEQQRIAIIRALQQPFTYLLMDEPFSHLDDENRSKAMHLIEEEAGKRNAAILLADLQLSKHFKAIRTLYL